MKITARGKKQFIQIFRKEGVLLAYIFGSSAIGNATRESDMDIAVLLPENLNKSDRFNIRLRLIDKLSSIFKKNIDMVVLNDTASLFFKYVIITEGQIIYEKFEGSRGQFESGIMGRYFDFQPFLNLYNKHYVQNNL